MARFLIGTVGQSRSDMSSSERLLPTTARDGDRLRNSYSACRFHLYPESPTFTALPSRTGFFNSLSVTFTAQINRASKSAPTYGCPSGEGKPRMGRALHRVDKAREPNIRLAEACISNGKSHMVLLSYLNLLSKRSQRRLRVPPREAMSSLRKGRTPVDASPMDLATQATISH
ncbi:hypothetical protein PGT21_011067 [Puccinia graminis f. sp. tritici]|uniref:Uncharacterized protein n=1 Tax=Puccinia graminis f. sp. tritici TaxID=56615 RepID=A0A5B0P7M4_PUCGR|nr:hypothetical protein PGT21_011067 [Puccinia graminis f. sp. tritici]